MKIKGYNRCIACMRLLGEDETCSYCHFQQEDYRPIPRCLRPGVELAGRYQMDIWKEIRIQQVLIAKMVKKCYSME